MIPPGKAGDVGCRGGDGGGGGSGGGRGGGGGSCGGGGGGDAGVNSADRMTVPAALNVGAVYIRSVPGINRGPHLLH